MNFFQELLLSKEFNERFSELVSGTPRKRNPKGFVTARRFMELPVSVADLNKPFNVGEIQFEKDKSGNEFYLSAEGMGAFDGNFDTVAMFVDDNPFIERGTLEDYLHFLHNRGAQTQDLYGVTANPLLLVAIPKLDTGYNILALQRKMDLNKFSEEYLEEGYFPRDISEIAKTSFSALTFLLKHSNLEDRDLRFTNAISESLMESEKYNSNVLVWSRDSSSFEDQIGKLDFFADDYIVDVSNVRRTIEGIRHGWPYDKGPRPSK